MRWHVHRRTPRLSNTDCLRPPPMDCHATTCESLLMPFCQCPKCKAVFTIQVADSKAWYTEKWPGYAATELVPEICPACTEGDGSDDRERWRSTATPIWPALRPCHTQTTPVACHAALRRLPRRAAGRSCIDATPLHPAPAWPTRLNGRTGWAAEQHDELRPPGTRSEWSGRRSAKRKRAAD